ncbi:MAG: ImuA family protein [Alphaproteobacteria bacterium]
MSDKEDRLARLRQHIARLEGGEAGRRIAIAPAPPASDAATGAARDMGRGTGPASALGVVTLGVAEIDRRLPGRGLQPGRLHEVAGAVEGAGTGFVVHLLRRLLDLDRGEGGGRPVLWCAPQASLYAPGLAGRGLDMDRFVMVVAPRREDRLWAMEESLRCPGVLAVVGELQGRESVDLTASRRLQLAAGQGGAMALLLRPPPGAAAGGGAIDEDETGAEDGAGPALGASTAVTRWLVRALPSAAADAASQNLGQDMGQDMGRASRWQLALTRSRTGARHRWTVEVDHATGNLALAAPLRDRSGVRTAVA